MTLHVRIVVAIVAMVLDVQLVQEESVLTLEQCFKSWILYLLRLCAWSRPPDGVPSILGSGLVNIGQPPDRTGSRMPLIFSGLNFF